MNNQAERCVLIVDDDNDFADTLSRLLSYEGYGVKVAHNILTVENLLKQCHCAIQVALIDLRLKGENGIDLIAKLQRLHPQLLTIIITAYASIETAIEAIQLGAYDYLRKPIHPDDLLMTLKRCYDHVELAEQKHVAETRYQALYDDNPSIFFTLDENSVIGSVNRYGAHYLGYGIADLIGRSFVELHSNDDDDSQRLLQQRLTDCLNIPGDVQRWEAAMLHSNGGQLWVRETARAIAADDGSLSMLLVCEDITDAHRLSAELSYQASHDELTGLFNRRAFEQRLELLLHSASEENVEHALCYLDLDQFKVINDSCGHVAGDELLRQLASLLQTKVRKSDSLARLGGDEFGLLMEYCSLDHARRVAETLRSTIDQFRFAWGERSFPIAASIGLVPINKDSEDISAVLSAADSVCYAAKELGRNRIQEYHPNDTKLKRHAREMHWLAHLHQLLEDNDNGLRLYHQPIQAFSKENTITDYCEILIRLPAEDGRIISPAAFLNVAERYNLIHQVDRWVIANTLDWLMSQPIFLAQLNCFSINLSGRSLGNNGEFLQFIIEQFRRTQVPAEKICFEITETSAFSNLNSAIRFISELKQLGCRFALDDFGSGLSSFSYLKNLPVDVLKIDGAFVKNIVNDPIDHAMVCSINDIGHLMGKQTVAEFVETEAVMNELQTIGVDYVQGYFIGRPQPINRLVEFDKADK